jgi:hypothetical protein
LGVVQPTVPASQGPRRDNGMLPAAITDLERSGISEADADACGLFDVENARDIYLDFRAEAALVIPYFHPNGEPMTFLRDGEELPFCRVRYVDPPPAPRGFTGKKKVDKYGQPGASGTRVYFPPNVPWETILQDVQVPLIITEGEKKAIAGGAAGFNVLGLGGVFNFAAAGSLDILPELELVSWRGRRLYIVFDSDALLNGQIQTAEARLVQELGIKRGAQVFIVRIPQDGEAKVGLDDFLLAHGPEALEALMEKTAALGRLDAMVVSLNKSVAWIEKEGCLFNLESREFISKDNFVTGSKFSSMKYITVGGKQRKGPNEISVAKTFLTHLHAQRFEYCLFRPGEKSLVHDDAGNAALNLWSGWNAEHGLTEKDPRIKAFLALSRFLFKDMEPADQDLPIKLMAFKAQNPKEKVDKCIVLVGPQGCGKSLWCECIAAAFGPYADFLNSAAFGSEFNSWVERSIIAVVNEANAQHLRQWGEKIKSLISDLIQPMRDLYRKARQVESYTMYLMTANDRAVGSFAADDRRMVVVGCPPKMRDEAGQALYTYLGKRDGAWHRTGGPAALMGWLLDYDLQGWRPPFDPPMTGEKYNSYRENLSVVQDLADKMATAQGENVIRFWLDASLDWAKENELSNTPHIAAQARAALDGMKQFPIRPFYEARELCLLFPNLANTILRTKFDQTAPPGLISRELRNNGVPFLRCKDDPRGFMWKGEIRQYLILVNRDEWEAPLSQAEFERYMREFPIYGRK